MHGRIYDPVTRTFLTPDPITNSPLKVSGWNKYAYVLNNPTKYTDPTGFADSSGGGDDPSSWGPITQTVPTVIITGSTPTVSTSNSDQQVPTTPSAVPGFDPGSSTDVGATPGSVQELQPEAYTITFYPHGPGTSDPFGLQPDFTVQPNWRVPTPLPSASDQLFAGGPGGGNTGWVLERPKPVPGVGDVYTAFFDPNATDEEKDAARAEIAVNGIFLAASALGDEAAEVADGLAVVAPRAPVTDFLSDTIVVSHNKVIARGTADLRGTLDAIESGKIGARDVFQNREGLLPAKPPGYYREFVHPTPGVQGAGPQRIIMGNGGELFYTSNHYKSFIPLN
jgi:hypothetical protein